MRKALHNCRFRPSEYIPKLPRGSGLGLSFVTSNTRGGVRCPPDQTDLEIDTKIEQRNELLLVIALTSLRVQSGYKQQQRDQNEYP
jgi:hypothetical protein